MKKILIALVVMMSLVSSSVSPQAIDLTCSQVVEGITAINTAYIPFFQEKNALVFSDAGTNGIACDYTVDSTLWEVNGILTNCGDAEGEGCAFVPAGFNNDCCCDQFITLESEIFDVLPELTVEDRDIVVPQALSDLSAALDCLSTEYLAECMDGIDQDGEGTDYPNDLRCVAPWDASETLADLQTNKDVSSATYFNDVKPCFVRAIKDFGILEQAVSRTTQAFFLTQKLQELEVELQHKLALEDEQAIQDFSVGVETCTGTSGAVGFDDLELSVEETSPGVLRVTITDSDGTISNGWQFEAFAYSPEGDADFPGNVLHAGDGVLNGNIVQVTTPDTQVGFVKVAGTPQISPIEFDLTFTVSDLAGDFAVFGPLDPDKSQNGGYMDDLSVFALYPFVGPIVGAGGTDEFGVDKINVFSPDARINFNIVPSAPQSIKGALVTAIIEQTNGGPVTLNVPDNTVESLGPDTTLSWGDTVYRTVLEGFLGNNGEDEYVRDATSDPDDVAALMSGFINDDGSLGDNSGLSSEPQAVPLPVAAPLAEDVVLMNPSYIDNLDGTVTASVEVGSFTGASDELVAIRLYWLTIREATDLGLQTVAVSDPSCTISETNSFLDGFLHSATNVNCPAGVDEFVTSVTTPDAEINNYAQVQLFIDDNVPNGFTPVARDVATSAAQRFALGQPGPFSIGNTIVGDIFAPTIRNAVSDVGFGIGAIPGPLVSVDFETMIGQESATVLAVGAGAGLLVPGYSGFTTATSALGAFPLTGATVQPFEFLVQASAVPERITLAGTTTGVFGADGLNSYDNYIDNNAKIVTVALFGGADTGASILSVSEDNGITGQFASSLSSANGTLALFIAAIIVLAIFIYVLRRRQS